MAIWQPPPPQPFIGGRQPLAPDVLPPSTILVDTPPKLYDGWQLNAVRLWDPPPPSPFEGGKQPLAPRTVTPSLLLVPNPPFSDVLRTQEYLALIRIWDPPAPQPFIGGRQPLAPRWGPPSTLLVDTPPKYSPARFDSIIRMWDAPPAWPVTALDKLIQEFVVAVAVQPPLNQLWFWSILTAWQPAPMPFQGRALSPGIPGLSVDPPPLIYRITQNEIARLWDPPPPWPVTALNKLVQEFVAVTANPPYSQAWLWAILNQWQIAYTIPQTRYLSPGIPGMSVDNPPPYERFYPTIYTKAWEPSVIRPQSQIYLPQPPIIVSVDNPPWGFPPDWLYSVLTSAWQPGQPLPKVLQKILQAGAPPVIATGQKEKRKWRRSSS